MRRLLLVTVVLTLATPATAPAYLYWVNGGTTPTIARASNDGTGVNLTFIANPGAGTNSLAVDGQHLYWGHDFNQAAPRSIGRANLDGTGVEPGFLPTQDPVGSVEVTPTKLYWSTSTQQIRSAGLDGSNPATVLTESGSGQMIQRFAVTSTNVYRERATTTGPASAQVVRTNLTGGEEAVYPMTGGTLTGLTAGTTGLFGFRYIGSAGGTQPLVRAPLAPAGTVTEIVPGDGSLGEALGLAGCRLFWTSRTSGQGTNGTIGTARIDGSQLNRTLITGNGLDFRTPSNDIVADRLPLEGDGCEGLDGASPSTSPTPTPTVTPSPTPTRTPLPVPTLDPTKDVAALSDRELDALNEALAELFFDNFRSVPASQLVRVKALNLAVANEVLTRMELRLAGSFGPGRVTDGLRSSPFAFQAKTPVTLFEGASTTGRATAYGPTSGSMEAALVRQAANQKAIDSASRKLRVAKTKAKRRKAKQALAKARKTRAQTTTAVVLERRPGAGKTLKTLRRRLKHGKAVTLRVTLELTDPAPGGRSVTRTSKLKLKPKR